MPVLTKTAVSADVMKVNGFEVFPTTQGTSWLVSTDLNEKYRFCSFSKGSLTIVINSSENINSMIGGRSVW